MEFTFEEWVPSINSYHSAIKFLHQLKIYCLIFS